MKSHTLLGAVLLMGLATTVCGQEPADAPATESSRPVTANGGEINREQLEKRFTSIDTLIEHSSAARQIEASGDVLATEKRELARQQYRSAKEAFSKGDLANASQLLSKASLSMFAAVRVAAPEQVTSAKIQADYNARLETVKALLSAHNRVAIEKSAPQGKETTKVIEKLMAEANQLASNGQYREGRKTLDRAYLVAKTAIANLRGGDTLVRSLHFASKEEEYHYEIDRNDTHQMLIKVLLSDKRAEQGTDMMINSFVDKAKTLRTSAEEAAGRKDFEAAIKLLEESTGEVVKAIRNAGIYIPG